MLHEHESNRQRLMKMGQLIFSPDIFTIRRGCVGLARLLLLAICLIVVTSISSTEAKADTLWNKLYSFSDTHILTSIVADRSGGCYIFVNAFAYLGQKTPLGYSASGNPILATRNNNYVLRLDHTGSILWRHKIEIGQGAMIRSTVLTSQGDVYCVGSENAPLSQDNPGGSNGFILKLSPAGKVNWRKQIGTHGFNEIEAVATDSRENIFVIGSTMSGNLFSPQGAVDTNKRLQAFAAKYDANGGFVWAEELGGKGAGSGGGTVGSAIALDSDSSIYIAGDTSDWFIPKKMGDRAGDGGFSYVARLSPNGSVLWLRRFHASGDDTKVSSLCVHNGSIYVAGTNQWADLNNTDDAFIASLDGQGQVRWTAYWSTPAAEGVTSLTTDTQGNLYAIGYTDGPLYGKGPRTRDGVIVKYNASGKPLWSRQTPISGYYDHEAIDDSRHLYLVGSVTDPKKPAAKSSPVMDKILIQKMSAKGQVELPLPYTGGRTVADALGGLPTASKHIRYPAVIKPLRFLWGDHEYSLHHPPLLIHGQPYFYAGYLLYGLARGSITANRKEMHISSSDQDLVIYPNNRKYLLNGQTRSMSRPPIEINSAWYVPLDVFKEVGMLPIHLNAAGSAVQADSAGIVFEN